jgi:hypothetical protein
MDSKSTDLTFTSTKLDHVAIDPNPNHRRNHMTTFTHNRVTRSFLLAGAVLFVGTGSGIATAADAQQQARSLLSGVAADHVAFPVSASEATQIDPQVQARWLLAGTQHEALRAPQSQKTVVAGASASDLARRLLAGKGS